MIALELIRRYWLHALTLAAVIWVGFALYGHGVKTERLRWKAEWAARDARDETARADAERAARTLEQSHQQAMNKVQADAIQELEQVRTDAAGANSAADRLRDQVGKLLAADRARQTAGTCASRTASTNPGNLLAIVLDRSIETNRELAAFADSAVVAARACQAAYGAVR